MHEENKENYYNLFKLSLIIKWQKVFWYFIKWFFFSHKIFNIKI